jgi:DNA-binding beta-propeller fold protein YncE
MKFGTRRFWASVVGVAGCAAALAAVPGVRQVPAGLDDVPVFEFDPSWPKRPLPNHWIMGNVAGMASDERDHIWVIQRPLSGNLSDDYAQQDPPAGECCRLPPSIIEFDTAGNVIQAFGGPDTKNPKGKRHPDGFEWPREHGLFIDHKGHVWTGSDEEGSSTITKLAHDGRLIKQKGMFGKGHSNQDTENFGQPAGLFVHAKDNEVYVADGYHNRRVIVMDADTLAFKRMWGAYGNRPMDIPKSEYKYDPDAPPSQQFSNPVHCVEISRDDLVYVCDRVNNRIQVFRKDGTFVKERIVAPRTRGFGAVHDIAFSGDPEERFLYVADGANRKVWMLRRDDLKILGSFGNGGHYAGEFAITHVMESDSKGNLYVGETIGGNRVQKFRFAGVRKAGARP